MKNIVVQKFGGTSLGSIERIKAVANTIKKTSLNEFPIIVVSAMSGAVSYTHLTLPTNREV